MERRQRTRCLEVSTGQTDQGLSANKGGEAGKNEIQPDHISRKGTEDA